MSYKKILDPVTNKMISLFSKKGRRVLKLYLEQLGGENEIPSLNWIPVKQTAGHIRDGVRIPSDQYGGFIRGGVRIPSTQMSGTVTDFYDSQYYSNNTPVTTTTTQHGGFIRGGVRIPSTQMSGSAGDFYDSQYYSNYTPVTTTTS